MNRAEQVASRIMQTQAGVIGYRQALASGIVQPQIDHLVRTGRWVRLHRGVYAALASVDSARRRHFAAYLAIGEPVAFSHRSAAWILALTKRVPEQVEVTVPGARRPRVEHLHVHRTVDFDATAITVVKGLPCTNVTWTLIDVAASGDEVVNPMLDVAFSRRLTTVDGLEREIGRRSRQGRPGPGRLARLMKSRGLSGGPAPSVLEAEMLALLTRWRLPLGKREVVYGDRGQYRVDFVIVPGLVVEVDGFAYHWSPEAKAYDDRRRNELRAQGLFVLVYSWMDVRFDARRVAAEIGAEVTKRAVA